MSRWFGRSSSPEAEPAGWPPVFESYEDFKADLDAAIKSHPPFGEWLRVYRNAALVVNGGRDNTAWKMSVRELKERYVQVKTYETRSKNVKRAIAEMHLEGNARKYQAAQDDFDAKQESYNDALARHELSKEYAVEHGLRWTIPQPRMPELPEVLREKAALERIVKE